MCRAFWLIGFKCRMLVASCWLLVLVAGTGCWCWLLVSRFAVTSHQQPATSNQPTAPLIKLRQVLRLSLGERAIDLETRIRPRANPIAVVQVRLDRRAVPRVCFVVASAGAQRTRPTGRAVRL